MHIENSDLVTVRDMLGIIEIRHMLKKNTKCKIRVISKDEYINVDTGEIFKFEKGKERKDKYRSLRRTFSNLRYLINNNFCGNSNELFVTLTYGGKERPMISDNEVFYRDFKVFMKTMRRKFGKIEYLTIVEPHADGHLHAHVLMKFMDYENIFIKNDVIAKIWKRGFVTVKGLDDVDNVGAYLSAYLSDIELTSETLVDSILKNENNEVKDINGKKIIKGGRLKYYVDDVNIYRRSRGIVMPEAKNIKYGEIKEKSGIRERKPDFVKEKIIDDEFFNVITYEYYNTRK